MLKAFPQAITWGTYAYMKTMTIYMYVLHIPRVRLIFKLNDIIVPYRLNWLLTSLCVNISSSPYVSTLQFFLQSPFEISVYNPTIPSLYPRTNSSLYYTDPAIPYPTISVDLVLDKITTDLATLQYINRLYISSFVTTLDTRESQQATLIAQKV